MLIPPILITITVLISLQGTHSIPLSASDEKCARNSGIPVQCIPPYRKLIYGMMKFPKKCHPVSWLKVLKEIKEKCDLDTGKPTKCEMGFGTPHPCRIHVEEWLQGIRDMTPECRKWGIDNIDYDNLKQLEKFQCLIAGSLLAGPNGSPIPARWDHVRWELSQDNTYCANRGLGWIDYKTLQECQLRCLYSKYKIMAYRPIRFGGGRDTGMCACCNDPPELLHEAGVSMYIYEDVLIGK